MESASGQPVQRRKVKAPNNAEDEREGDVKGGFATAGAGVGMGVGAVFGAVLGSVILPGPGTVLGAAMFGAAVGGVAGRKTLGGVGAAAGAAGEWRERVKHIEELMKQQQRYFATQRNVLVAVAVVLAILCAVMLWLVYGRE